MNASSGVPYPPRDYGSYLQLDRLLDLQTALSCPEHPDELHFIVTHQAIELWFKVMIQDVRCVRDHVQNMEWIPACEILKRLHAVLDSAITQIRTLRTLGSVRFSQFRSFLGSASGFQSIQFRELEVLNGIRHNDYLRMIEKTYGGTLPEPIAAALREPSLSEAVQSAARKAGVLHWADIYADRDEYGDVRLLAESLLDYEELWLRWRTEHVLLVRRIIGTATEGTGGASDNYLASTLVIRFFPFLWEISGLVIARADRACAQ